MLLRSLIVNQYFYRLVFENFPSQDQAHAGSLFKLWFGNKKLYIFFWPRRFVNATFVIVNQYFFLVRV